MRDEERHSPVSCSGTLVTPTDSLTWLSFSPRFRRCFLRRFFLGRLQEMTPRIDWEEMLKCNPFCGGKYLSENKLVAMVY